MKILGIDYGDRYVGLASCDGEEILAYPLRSVKVKRMREAVDVCAAAAAEEGVGLIVLGLPLMPDGTEGGRASKTRAFGRVLAKVSALPVEFYDERLTTVQAEEYLAQAGIARKNMKKYTDAASAQIILGDYIASARRPRSI